ncbi:hypothetical protein YC2023_098128 [Brassica napus]
MTKSETLVIVGTSVQTNEEVAIKLVSGKCEDCATPGYIVVHSVRGFCVWDCGVPWHDSVSSEEFQILPVDERYPDHCITWLEYREGQHSCTCDTFNSMPRVMDAYSEQERSQLALIQRFLVVLSEMTLEIEVV